MGGSVLVLLPAVTRWVPTRCAFDSARPICNDGCRMSAPRTVNFEHLLVLDFILRPKLDLVMDALHQAERTHKLSPSGAVMLLRTAGEVLANSFEQHLKLPSIEKRELGIIGRFREVRNHYFSKQLPGLARAWDDLQECYRDWSEVVHGRTIADAPYALSQLNRMHAATGTMVRALVPDGRPQAFVQPGDILSELDAAWIAQQELCRAATISSASAADAQMRTQEARLALDVTGAELVEANGEIARLRTKVQNDQGNAQLRDLLLTSEGRAVELEEQARQRAEALMEAESRQAIASRQVSELQLQLGVLRDRESETLVALEAKIEELARFRRYPDAYPGIEEAAAFFEESIAAAGGPLAPFSEVGVPHRIEGDPFADRYEGIFRGNTCTVRMITARSARPVSEILDAWEAEAQNLVRLGSFIGNALLATLLEAALPEKPGFSIFSRPSGRLLSELWEEGLALGIEGAASATASLISALGLRRQLGLFATVPDAHCVVVGAGTVTLLDPSATHCGDLGPGRLRALAHSEHRYLAQPELDDVTVYASAMAFTRMLGAAPLTTLAEDENHRCIRDLLPAGIESALRRAKRSFAADKITGLKAITLAAIAPRAVDRPSVREWLSTLRDAARTT